MKHFLYLMLFIPGGSILAQDSLKTLDLQEVVVTGQFEPQSLRKSVYQVRTINSDIISARNATNVQNILNTELGIRFSNDPALGTSDISLMGMSGQNVKILLDGVPLLDRGGVRESLNQIDVNTIKRIEIVEGPMSVVYGTDALAGVINIITKEVVDEASGLSISTRILEETANTEYNAFAQEGVHNENVNIAWQGSSWNAGGGVTRNNFGGWQGNLSGRAKQWLPKDQWLGDASMGYSRDDFNIWYRLNYVNEIINLLGDANPNTDISIDKDYITNRFTHQTQTDWRINEKWNFNGIISHQDYSRKTRTTTFNTITNERRLSSDPGSQDEAQFTSSLFRGIFLYKISSKVSLQPGVDINLNKGFGERIDGARTINDYALFVSGEIAPKSFISIRPGLRFTHNSVYNAPPVIPSLNAKFVLNDKLDLRLAYGYGFRAPSLRELYFYFFDASHSIKGNPDLKAEYSNSFSGSLAWQPYASSTFRVSSTLGSFYNAFENLITIGVDAQNSSVNTYVNVYKYRTAGVTLSNMASWKRLKAGVGFSYIGVYNQLSEEERALPTLMYTPEVNTTLAYSFLKTGTTVSLFYKFTGKRSSYQTATVDNEQVVTQVTRAAYDWADVTATQRIGKYINLSVGVKNLFDVTSIQNTQDTGSAHNPAGPVPVSYGRSYFVGLNFQL